MNEDEAQRAAAADKLLRGEIDKLRARIHAVQEQNAKADAIREQAERDRRDAILTAIDAGLSQSEIARQLGLTQQAVSKIVRNV